MLPTCSMILTVTLIFLSSISFSSQNVCPQIPNPFPIKKAYIDSSYNATRETLYLDLTDLLYKFCDYNNTGGSVRVELVRTTSREKMNNLSCQTLDSKARLQSVVHLSPAHPVTTFQFVQGRYFLRLSDCTQQGCPLVACSKIMKLKPEVVKDSETCNQKPANASSFRVKDITHLLDFHTCSVSIETTVPTCTAVQRYHRAKVYTIALEHNDQECDMNNFFAANQIENATISVRKTCLNKESSENSSSSCSESTTGLLKHNLYDLNRNTSFCVFYQLENPHCSSVGRFRRDLPCFFHSSKIICSKLELSPFALLTEPMFIGVVSLTLFLSLALLMWTVVQCSRKRPETPIQQPIKKPPRSLTEDDLEHISRLPSQEIVLVYFPDTKRFKELNRKFRNWLITLDVNDVKDIYDEKCSEEVLRDPEKWVREALGGPEKRIILMCSRLAYECLVTVKKGISSPKFVETDPHFGLLTRAIQYLDREMKGNYRNLICVRYEDIKICDRQYSSEAFNIVPGTEYVLPQHLEDVYRWIHPRDPKPECWSESRQEVRELLEFMKKYRHHDDNMFTVQFNSSGNIETTSTTPVGDMPRILGS